MAYDLAPPIRNQRYQKRIFGEEGINQTGIVWIAKGDSP